MERAEKIAKEEKIRDQEREEAIKKIEMEYSLLFHCSMR